MLRLGFVWPWIGGRAVGEDSRESNLQPPACIGGRWGTWEGESSWGERRGLGELRFGIGGREGVNCDGVLVVGCWVDSGMVSGCSPVGVFGEVGEEDVEGRVSITFG